jgi:MOSC domain-containing protein YiiM
MKLLSVNVGLPREIFHEGRIIRSGIYKTPVEGPVRVNALNIEGDQQADLTVHGGPSKAIYVYPNEHYAFWRKELPEVEFPCGSFGENLSTEGLLEMELNIGDRLCVGSVELGSSHPVRVRGLYPARFVIPSLPFWSHPVRVRGLKLWL